MAVHLIVVGLLTSLNCAIGKEDVEELPIVNVTGPQELIRESDLSCAVEVTYLRTA